MNLTLEPKHQVKDNDKHGKELYLFSCETESLSRAVANMENLKVLVIINQLRIKSFGAVENLIHLQELWIVECKLKEVPDLNSCSQLEKLCLYSNEIENIPNLENCQRLKTLYISGNNIHSLKNVNSMKCLKELNIAQNKLKNIDHSFLSNSKLRYINLANNPLHRIQDIQLLTHNTQLGCLVFSDPQYGECPIVSFNNYRIYVIISLPKLKKLDHFTIYDEERKRATEAFKKNVLDANMLLHQTLNKYLINLKNKYSEHRNQSSFLKKKLWAMKMKDLQNDGLISENPIVELHDKELCKWEENMFMHLQTQLQQIKLNFTSYGNIKFTQHDMNNSINQDVKNVMERSMCSITERMGISGVTIQRTTEVFDKRIDVSRISNDSIFCENDIVFMFLIMPFEIDEIHNWPIKLFANVSFYEREFCQITNCLAKVDDFWLNNLTNKTLTNKTRLCVLSRVLKNKKENSIHQYSSNHECKKFVFKNHQLVNPIFVIEYEYNWKTRYNEDKLENFLSLVPDEIPNLKFTRRLILTNPYLYEQGFENLVNISLIGQNITAIDSTIDFPNLRSFNISYNRLKKFPHCKIFKHLETLNLSFNQITNMEIVEILPTLTQLDLSWNSLIDCQESLQIFKTFTPSLENLNVKNNPFREIICRSKLMLVTKEVLPKLRFINGFSYEESFQRSTNVWLCTEHEMEQSCPNNYLNYNSTLEKIQSPILETRGKCLHLFNGVFQDLNIFNQVSQIIEEICISNCAMTELPRQYFHNLVRLNLANNSITTSIDLTQDRFANLEYLDLTNNCLTSINAMGTWNSLLEFYCSHNRIKNLTEIENLANWNGLCVIDLSNNPINDNVWCKHFIIYHLNGIQYVSGQCITPSDFIEAQNVFCSLLDKNTLTSILGTNQLKNLRQLSIIDCSVKKINLDSNILPNLESLDLSQNHITSLQGFYYLKRLNTLRLSCNNIKATENNDQSVFPSLHTLYLDHNRIRLLINMNLRGMPVLKHLCLSHNQIRDINGIENCHVLETLILDYNEIRHIRDQDLPEINNIKCLMIEDNVLKTLNFVYRLPKLEKLFAAHNNLSNTSTLECLKTLNQLQELTLIGNPLCKTIDHYAFCIQNIINISSIDLIIFPKTESLLDDYNDNDDML